MVQHPDDSLVDMVLGQLSAEAHAAHHEHLRDCAECRAAAKHLLGVVDEVTRLAPAAEPSDGFADRVINGLDPAPLSLRRQRRTRRRWPAAAVAAACIGLGVGAWAALSGQPDGPSGALDGPAASIDTRAVALLTGNLREVGTASFGRDPAGSRTIRVALTGTPPAPWYRCEARFADGTATTLGSWSATDGDAWVLNLAGTDRPVTLALVTASGKVWATANFPA